MRLIILLVACFAMAGLAGCGLKAEPARPTAESS